MCVSSALRCTAHCEHVHFGSLSVLVYACQMDSLSTRGWVCMCQSVQVLGTAVGDVTPMRSPTLQTLHAPVAFLAHASSRHSFVTPSLPPSLQPHLIPCSASVSAFHPSPNCSRLLILEPIDLQHGCVNRGIVDILQRLTL